MKNPFLSLMILPTLALAESPDWVKNKPTGYQNDYRLCYSIGDRDFQLGEQKALESCIKELSFMDGILVGESKTEYKRTNEKFEINSNLKYKSEETNVNFEIREKYFGYNENREKESYLLISYPKKQPIPLPSMAELTVKQLVFPGWAELSIGESYKGQLRGLNSAFLLIGAATAFAIMHDAYGDSRDSRTIEDRRIYRQKADFYRNWSVGFSLTYIVYSVYTTMDIRHSDYLHKYL